MTFNLHSLFARCGITIPLFQAPTGSIAGPELCAAVSKTGAVGAMGLTWTPPEMAAKQIHEVQAVTDHPFQANFALHFPPDALLTALALHVPIITFSWGDPSPYIATCHDAGAIVGVQVTTPVGVERAIKCGADFLICQGVEAGGHVQSTTVLMDLLPRVISVAGNTPIIAAGGIGDAGGVQWAMAQGATGVMCGTRFVATVESRAHPDYKTALLAAQAMDTALTVCFEGGWPYAAHRVLRNKTLEAWEAAGSPGIGERPGEGETVACTANGEAIYRYEDTAPRAGMTGSINEMCLYAGTSVSTIADIPTAAEIVTRLMQTESIDTTV